MLEAVNLHKTFRRPWWQFTEPVSVLRGFSLSAQPGEVVGIVGPNGAGKTTVFRLLAGLERPDSGRLSIDGVDPASDPAAARGTVALMPEEPNVGRSQTGAEHLEWFAILNGLGLADRVRRLAEVIDAFDMGSFIHRPAAGYSRGQGVRVSVARMALSNARVLVFDEPTVGLDLDSAARVRVFIKERAAMGHTVLVASHIVSDIVSLCTRVVGLSGGTCVPAEEVQGWSGLVPSPSPPEKGAS